ncbi:MAG: TetR/AcrR family transcriptional regulator [Devosiaceae bacterium]|nr:TetR/AcrR family transcriptional regulator [Devosiaceae bacterium]
MTSKVMKKKIPLNALDWIKGGFRALALGGPQAIRVEAIARQMKVSKGSFYWHFKDVGALKTAMLENWARLATYEAIAEVEQEADEGRTRLFALIRLATGSQNEQYGGAATETAIRSWARVDKNVALVVKKIESDRLAFVSALFEDAGIETSKSIQSARLLYGAMIGLEQLPGSNRAKVRKDLEVLLEILL